MKWWIDRKYLLPLPPKISEKKIKGWIYIKTNGKCQKQYHHAEKNAEVNGADKNTKLIVNKCNEQNAQKQTL